MNDILKRALKHAERREFLIVLDQSWRDLDKQYMTAFDYLIAYLAPIHGCITPKLTGRSKATVAVERCVMRWVRKT